MFDFIEVIAILREKYNLKPTNEELNTGKKFSFALYFDKKLNYMQDMMFFAESAYIRYFKKIPNKAEFKIFEDELKKNLLSFLMSPQKMQISSIKHLTKS